MFSKGSLHYLENEMSSEFNLLFTTFASEFPKKSSLKFKDNLYLRAVMI